MEYIRAHFKDINLRGIMLVSDRMALDADAARAFWPRYRIYMDELVRLRDQHLDILSEYARDLNGGRLDDAKASASLQRSLSLEEARIASRRQMLEQVGRVLTPRQVLHLYQLELLMEAQIKAGLLEQIPAP